MRQRQIWPKRPGSRGKQLPKAFCAQPVQSPERGALGKALVGVVEQEVPGSYLSIRAPSPAGPRRPTPPPPPPSGSPTRGYGAGLGDGQAAGGRAHHATRDVPWREAALGALVVHSAPGAG